MSSLTRFTITAPRADNDGRALPAFGLPTYAEYARTEVLARFDGATSMQGRGYWRSPDGAEYEEPVTIWTIDAPTDAARLVIDAARLIGTYADQEAIYVTALDADGFRTALVTQDGRDRTILDPVSLPAAA